LAPKAVFKMPPSPVQPRKEN